MLQAESKSEFVLTSVLFCLFLMSHLDAVSIDVRKKDLPAEKSEKVLYSQLSLL